MTETEKAPVNLLEALMASFEAALRSPEGVAPPAVLLWTDVDGQWRPLLGALRSALPLLATEPIAGLRGRRLEAEDFDRLSIGDPVRDVLLWMSDPEGFHARCDAARRQTFRTVCMREFDLDPEQGGPEAAGQLLLH